MLLPKSVYLVKKIILVCRREVILCTSFSSQRCAIGELLEIVKSCCNAPIPIYTESIKADGSTPFYSRVHFGTFNDWITVGIYDTRCCTGIGIDEVAVFVVCIIRSFQITITKWCFQCRKCRYRFTGAFQLVLAFVIGSLNSIVDFLDGLEVRLRNDE